MSDPRIIHLWSLRLADVEQALPAWVALLSEEERRRYLRADGSPSHLDAGHTRAALRVIMGLELAVDPREVRFDRGPHGKPRLAADHASSLRFNLSHSHGHALLAVAPGLEVGVDIEAIRPRPHWRAIARRFFHADEVARLEPLDPEVGYERFVEMHAQKEAVAKALGFGLARTFRRFSVPDAVAPEKPARVVLPEDLAERRDWGLVELRASPRGYRAALCAEGTNWRVEERTFPPK